MVLPLPLLRPHVLRSQPASPLRLSRLGMVLPVILIVVALFSPSALSPAKAQINPDGRSLTLRSDIQEANAKTGVVTARGNVQINYPARQIQATSAQAQYFSRERRIVLSGNVYVLQQGNSMRGETITYLIDEGRFIATPQSQQQVEATYIVIDPNPTESTPTPGVPPFAAPDNSSNSTQP